MLFIIIQVPHEVLIDRSVGRRMDPMTGKIYHLKKFLPETQENEAKLVTCPRDTPEKVGIPSLVISDIA